MSRCTRCQSLTFVFIGLFSLIVGTISFVIQLVMYACITEQIAIKVVVILLAIFTLLPLLHFIPLNGLKQLLAQL